MKVHEIINTCIVYVRPISSLYPIIDVKKRAEEIKNVKKRKKRDINKKRKKRFLHLCIQ